MKRSEVREHIFKIVFRAEFYPKEDWKDQSDIYLEQLMQQRESEFIEKHELDSEEDDASLYEYREYLKQDLEVIGEKVENVLENLEEIDQVIGQISEGWKIARIGKVELAILRVAIYEIQKDEDIPDGVAINEAVELAKNYGTNKSASFVNGLLAKIMRE